MRVNRFYIVLFATLFGSQTLAQTDAGCPSIDIGENLQIECANTCVDLTADVLEIGNTTSYVVESIDYSPFPFNQGTPILVGLDDVWSELIPIPFEFCFFENSYNELVIGANGVITFDTNFASPPDFDFFNGIFCDWNFNLPIPNTTNTPYRNSINGAYHDIDPSRAGNIRIDVVGEAPCRIFIINYEDIPHYSFPNYLCSSIKTSQQILLYETTNVIEVIIEDKPVCGSWNNGNAVIGIQNIDGTLGYVPPDRNTGDWSAINEAWRFVPSENESYEIEWFDQDGMSLGNGTEVTVCPNINSAYSATVTYTACNGTEVSESDAISVSIIGKGPTSSTNIIACDSVLWNGNIYNVSGSYEFLTTNSNGCDSIATLNLTINTPTSSVSDIVACEEYFWNNNLYTTSGSYIYESLNSNGCDSTATLNLIISSSTSSFSEVESCVPIQWNGNTYDSSGEYVFNTVNSNGCDSTAILSLTINQISSSLTEISSCESYLWNGILYNSSGVYTYETINENGCDSIATLDLNIYASSTSFTIAEECNEYAWNGNTYTTSGIYLLEFQDVNGCDSTATLSLTINEPTTSTTIVNDCEPYLWNGNLYEETGSYTYLTINNNGCDSTATLELTINPSTSSLTTVTSCEPYEWNGSVYDTSGSYSFQTFNENGCDSIANLNLTIADVSTSFSKASSCEEYIWNGDTYTTSGVYQYHSIDINGCDSIATLDLTINSTSASLTLASSCTDYFWNGNNYSSSGIYEYQTVNSNGCDSIAALELTITPSTSSNTSISACNEYDWNDSTYSSSGQYTYQTINSNGCDSIANLTLTINSSTSSISNISSCVPITWNGELYNTTGIYDFLTTNSNGCDSVATLDLVINEDLIDETYTTVNSCEKFVWNDETYITSGDYIYVSSNQYGCDSISYLSLNIYSNYIYVPTAFTPDNDGHNDAFKVESETLQVFELNIYNRWGEKIFKTNNLNEPWDGSYNNGDYFCPDGVYTWQVKYRCESEIYEKRGHVTMLR